MSTPNWKDKTIYTGDNLYVMRGMNSETVNLIYLDPPFNSNRDYAAPIGSRAAGAAFKDTWELSDVDHMEAMRLKEDYSEGLYKAIETAEYTHSKSMRSYLTMMASRLVEMHRLLKPTGCIYLHCDHTASHYLKQLMDAIFGKHNFRNEIIWCYPPKGQPPKLGFPHKHDTLFYYSKSKEGQFTQPYTELDDYQKGKFSKVDSAGRHYKEFKGKRTYLDESKGRPVPSWWTDIAPASQSRTEYLNYPTQKPEKLLARIIQASSKEGDVILDPFCGSGTALVAAEKQDATRHWVGIDISPLATHVLKDRIQATPGLCVNITASTENPQRTDLGRDLAEPVRSASSLSRAALN